MMNEEQIMSLLVHWEEQLTQGRELTPEQLCPHDTDAQEAIRPRLARRKLLHAQLGLRPCDTPAKAGEMERTNVNQDTAVTPPLDFLAPAQQSDELGRLGNYRVLKVLGQGGMGMVFLAEDALLQRSVALKVILSSQAQGMINEDTRKRFVREGRLAASLKHDHVVTIYQVGEDRGVPFLAMELLRGESLEQRLEREPRFPVSEVLRIGQDIARGLAAAHECGLIHRDIKPGNLWLESPSSRVKLLDFGLARGKADDQHLTQSGAIVGTPAYMAPEQARSENIDPRSDLFSLGCVLYRLCTGQPPFRGENTMAVLMAISLDQPQPPCLINPDVPTALSDLIVRLL